MVWVGEWNCLIDCEGFKIKVVLFIFFVKGWFDVSCEFEIEKEEIDFGRFVVVIW